MNNHSLTTRSIKILQLASGDLWAGAEMQLFTLSSQLHKNDEVALTVVLLNHGRLEEELKAKGISVFIIDEQKFNSFDVFKKLIALFKEIKPDVLHTHRIKENILGCIAAKYAGIATMVRTVHGALECSPPFWKIWRHMLLQTDLLCANYLFSKTIAVSSDLADVLNNKCVKNLVVIENGVDIESINNIQIDGNIKNNNKSIKVGIICRLVPVKRVDLFIDVACKFLRTTDYDVEFYIFGDGPLQDECNRQIELSGYADKIRMMGFQDNILSWLKCMDLLMITSDHEGLPMNLLEAMSLQVPVISHAVGGIVKVLGEGRYGLLVENQSIDAYVDAIQKFIREPEVYKQKAVDGFDFIRCHYSAKSNAEACLSLYHEILGHLDISRG